MQKGVSRRAFVDLVKTRKIIEEKKKRNEDVTALEEEYYKRRNEIVENYLNIAYDIASLSFFEDIIASEEDRKQIAAFLLVKAVDTYDPSQKCLFSAYGRRRVFYGMLRELYKLNTSTPAGDLIYAIRKIEENFLKTMGIKASFTDICKILDITEEQLAKIKEYEARVFPNSIEDVFDNRNDKENIINRLQDGDRVVEINGELYDDDGNIIEGNSIDDDENFGEERRRGSIQERTVEYHELKEYIRRSFHNLTPLQREIIERYYGFRGEPEEGTKIARSKGTSKQSVHLNKRIVMKKLSTKYKKVKLEEYDDYEEIK